MLRTTVLSLLCILLGVIAIGRIEAIKKGTFDHILIINFENEWVYDALKVVSRSESVIYQI